MSTRERLVEAQADISPWHVAAWLAILFAVTLAAFMVARGAVPGQSGRALQHSTERK